MTPMTLEEATTLVKVGRQYEHTKGGRYEVVGIALESTNGRPRVPVVVYRGSQGLNVRDLSEFIEVVEGRPRFKLAD